MRIKMQDVFPFGTKLNQVEVPDKMKQKLSSGM